MGSDSEVTVTGPTIIRPRLRSLDLRWIEHQGSSLLHLRDPLALADDSVLVPAPLVPFLALCDGSRDAGSLGAAFALRTGVDLGEERIRELLDRLESCLLLEGEAYEAALEKALAEYRSPPARPPFHAGAVYPEDAGELRETIAGLCYEAPSAAVGGGRLVGMLCPHIDYARGGLTYARTWRSAAADLPGIERVIVLGTDHSGGPAAITPTRQNYSTPLGVLRTAGDAVERVVAAVGEQAAFAEELHHRSEHSIELACVWMHAFTEPDPPDVVPVLCGSFAHFVAGEGSPADDTRLDAAIDALAEIAAERPTLVVAAADLAHVGPTFGDQSPVLAPARDALRGHDEESLGQICEGNGKGFLALSIAEGDRRRICGLSPIYIMLEVIARCGVGPVTGVSMGYDQCAADREEHSLVSIAGALLYA